MIAFYFDENANGAIVEGRRGRGVDILTVLEDGREGAADPVVMDRATELGRVLFSYDEDMLILAQERQQAGAAFSGVIFARQRRVSVGVIVEDLDLIAHYETPEDCRDRVEFLPLR